MSSRLEDEGAERGAGGGDAATVDGDEGSNSSTNRKPRQSQGKWSVEEDMKLTKLVDQIGMKQWATIAQNMPGRSGKQVREATSAYSLYYVKAPVTRHLSNN